MAFDLYAGERHTAISGQDEYLFALAAEQPSKFPQLLTIQARFYGSFTLSAEQANALVHELLWLHELHGASVGKGMAALTLRLCEFFSAAVRGQLNVRCVGD